MTIIRSNQKVICHVNTPRSALGLSAALNGTTLRTQLENRITALAATDAQTPGVPSFRHRLKVFSVGVGRLDIYPKLGVTVDTLRTLEELQVEFATYIDDAKTDLRNVLAAFPDVLITGWHVHRVANSADEVEP